MPDAIRGARAILDALRFDGKPYSLANLSSEDLAFADRVQLTPLLTRVDFPASARGHIESALSRNAIRAERVAAAYEEIAPAFDHVLLKGVTHVPDFVDDVRLRVQYDLDLYVPPEQKERARDALVKLGYESIGGLEGLAMDHLPTMIRKTGWQWRGDYFDPDFPAAVEVHFRFWDEPTERLPVEGLDEFWIRREGNRLALPDRLAYAALHLTRHLLRGNVRPSHVWEIARFLETHHDAEFWRMWAEWHSPSLRRLEAVAFLLAQWWFGCKLPHAAEEAVRGLPEPVHRWFETYGWSPIEGMFKPNKHELWLHMSLLESAWDRYEVLRRRLIPLSRPGPADAVHIPRDQMTFARRVLKVVRNGGYAISRGWHHARLLVPTVWEGVRWVRRR
jgi:hypothetical protein